MFSLIHFNNHVTENRCRRHLKQNRERKCAFILALQLQMTKAQSDWILLQSIKTETYHLHSRRHHKCLVPCKRIFGTCDIP